MKKLFAVLLGLALTAAAFAVPVPSASTDTPITFTIEKACYISITPNSTYPDTAFNLTATAQDLLDDGLASASGTVLTTLGSNFPGFVSASVAWDTVPADTAGVWSMQLDGFLPPSICPVSDIHCEKVFDGGRETPMRVIISVDGVEKNVDWAGQWTGTVTVNVSDTALF